MLVHVKRTEFLTAASQTAQAAPRKTSVDLLKCVHIAADSRGSTLTLTATNQEIAIQTTLGASVEEAGCAVLDAALLPALLARLPEEEVTLERRGERQTVIRSGRAVYVLNGRPGEEYPLPELPFPEDAVTVSGLHTLARSTLFAAAADGDQPVLQCIRLSLTGEGLRASGTNGFCVVEAAGDKNCRGDVQLLLPAHALKALAAISLDSDVYELGLTDGGKRVTFWNGTTLFSARLMEGHFPDTADVLNRFTPASRVQVDASALAQALTTAGSLTDDTRVGLALTDGRLLVSGQTERGAASAQVKAEVETGAAGPFYYNHEMLRAFLALARGSVTLEVDRQGLLSVRQGGARYLQAPMRPPRQTAQTGRAA